MNYQSDNSFQSSSNQSGYIQSAYSSPQFYHHNQLTVNNSVPLPTSPHQQQQHYNNQNLLLKTNATSMRYGSNSELSKKSSRNHPNSSYELSQDLQEKKIELLERKYGGSVRAQRAALIIQRAYRRYMLDRKFASIRANANIEKRNSTSSHQYHPNENYQRIVASQSMEMPTNFMNSSPSPAALNFSREPSARMLGGERRGLEFESSPTSASSIRNLHVSKTNPSPHPYVNLLHQQQQPSPLQCYPPHQQQLQYQTSLNSMNQLHLQSDLNQTWNHNKPAQPSQIGTALSHHYTASQIFMRPKQTNLLNQQQQQQQYQYGAKKTLPPEVPKRISSNSVHKKSNGMIKTCELKVDWAPQSSTYLMNPIILYSELKLTKKCVFFSRIFFFSQRTTVVCSRFSLRAVKVVFRLKKFKVITILIVVLRHYGNHKLMMMALRASYTWRKTRPPTATNWPKSYGNASIG